MKFIKNEDNGETKWAFVVEDKSTDYENQSLINILNKLGKNGWQLASVDDNIGFIMKRRK